MSEIQFYYNGDYTYYFCNKEDSVKDLLNKFTTKIGKNIDDLYFLNNGKNINEELTFKEIINSEKNNKITILAYDNSNNNVKSQKIKSKDIICPICGENTSIKIKDYNIILNGCKNGHLINDISLKEFEKSQYIDASKIKCGKCNDKNKGNTYNNEFYRCCTCKMNLCPLCKSSHNLEHNIINYDGKNYFCEKHEERYCSYCETCNENLCLLCECEKKHANHKIIDFKNLIKHKDSLNNELNNMKTKIDKVIIIINQLIDKLNDILNNIQAIYNIYKNIIDNYTIYRRNYQILSTVNELFNNNIIDDLNNIINRKNIFDILNLYHKMNKNKDKDKDIQIWKIIYDINGEKEINIFGSNFVKNNINNCKMILDNNEHILSSNYQIKNNNTNKLLEIKLKINNKMTDMSYMFNNCSSLSYLNDFSNWNTNKITNMSNMFNYCKTLKNIPDISKWDTSNVTDMSYMFANCKSLKSIPNISEWNINKKAIMNDMFLNCETLFLLSDISKWDKNSVIYKNFIKEKEEYKNENINNKNTKNKTNNLLNNDMKIYEEEIIN